MTEKLAKGVRIATVPPILVSVLLFLLYFSGLGIINSAPELIFGIIFLAILPASAYPISTLVPSLRSLGRNAQRNLAFVMSIAGYVLGVIYAYTSSVSSEYRVLFTTYLVSVIILTFFNKVIKVRASGHACGTFGPMLPTIYFLGWHWVFPCIALCVGVVWSSLKLSRHTRRELLLGALSSVSAFIICTLVML